MEKLNLWDRFFNRYKRVIMCEGEEQWFNQSYYGIKMPGSEHTRKFVKYKIIDRVTGSEKIEKVYLNT